MRDESALRATRVGLSGFSGQLKWLPMLLFRLVLGGLFFSTGWGKVHDLAKVTHYFGSELHIPNPSFFAGLVGWSELICGALLLVGLFSRLATIPLMTTMIVAIATAKHGEIHSVLDLFGQVEFTYACMLLAIFVIGPGAISLDGAVAGSIDHMRPRWRRHHEHAY